VPYAQVKASIVSKTAGSESGKLEWITRRAGSLTTEGAVAGGMTLGNPTGGAKGVGTLNLAGSSGLHVSLNGGAGVYSGTGSPESAVTASVGSIFLRTDGGAATTLYVKESGSGNTGWIAK
jgi:hypothetical protein